jgi:1-acyl-sn-glycerol-3-phosphate acyltransferase
MRRAVLGLYNYAEFFLNAVLFVPILGAVTLLHGRRDPGRRIRGRWMRRFGWWCSALSPLWRFSWDGTPPADIKTRAYVVVANHESTSDPFLLCYLPWDMRWIAKEEIFRLPIIGWLMKFSGDIPLRRGERDSIQQTMQEARRTLDAGVPIMIFPEGTRSPDGHLLPFKDGAFRLAIEAGVPILPLALTGTRQCRPKGSLWFGDADARVRVLEPIDTAGKTLEDVPRLRDETRARIEAGLAELRRDLTAEFGPAVAAGPEASSRG